MKKSLSLLVLLCTVFTSWSFNARDLKTIKKRDSFAYKARGAWRHSHKLVGKKARRKRREKITNEWMPGQWANKKYADLSGADLSGLDMMGIWLRHADLSGATLTGVDLSNSRFDKVKFDGATFKDADLSHSEFYGCTTTGADFMNASLEDTKRNGLKITRIHVECKKGVNTTLHNSKCPAGNYLNFCKRCFYSPKTKRLTCQECSEKIGANKGATRPDDLPENFEFKNLSLENITNNGLLYTKNIDLSPDGKLFESGPVIEQGWEECVKDVNTTPERSHCPKGEYLNFCSGCSYNGQQRILKCLVCNDVIEQRAAQQMQKKEGDNVAIVQTKKGTLANYANRVLTNIEPVLLHTANIVFDTNGQLRKGVNLTKGDIRKNKLLAGFEAFGIAVGAIAATVIVYKAGKSLLKKFANSNPADDLLKTLDNNAEVTLKYQSKGLQKELKAAQNELNKIRLKKLNYEKTTQFKKLKTLQSRLSKLRSLEEEALELGKNYSQYSSQIDDITNTLKKFDDYQAINTKFKQAEKAYNTASAKYNKFFSDNKAGYKELFQAKPQNFADEVTSLTDNVANTADNTATTSIDISDGNISSAEDLFGLGGDDTIANAEDLFGLSDDIYEPSTIPNNAKNTTITKAENAEIDTILNAGKKKPFSDIKGLSEEISHTKDWLNTEIKNGLKDKLIIKNYNGSYSVAKNIPQNKIARANLYIKDINDLSKTLKSLQSNLSIAKSKSPIQKALKTAIRGTAVAGAITGAVAAPISLSKSVKNSFKEREATKFHSSKLIGTQKAGHCPHGDLCPVYGTYQYLCANCSIDLQPTVKRRIPHLKCYCLNEKNKPYYSILKIYGDPKKAVANVYSGNLYQAGRYKPHAAKRRPILGYRIPQVRREVLAHQKKTKQAFEQYKKIRSQEANNITAFAAQGKQKELQQLIKKGFDNLDRKDEQGRTGLILAIQNGHFECAASLIKAGADINHQDKQGRSALMHLFIDSKLTEKEKVDTTGLLLNQMVDVDAQDKAGKTTAYYLKAAPDFKLKQVLLQRLKK